MGYKFRDTGLVTKFTKFGTPQNFPAIQYILFILVAKDTYNVSTYIVLTDVAHHSHSNKDY